MVEQGSVKGNLMPGPPSIGSMRPRISMIMRAEHLHCGLGLLERMLATRVRNDSNITNQYRLLEHSCFTSRQTVGE